MTSFQVRLVKKKPVDKGESSAEREISPLNDIPKAEFATVSSSESMKTVINGKEEKEEAGPSNDSSDGGSASELRKKLTEKIIEQKFVVNGEVCPLFPFFVLSSIYDISLLYTTQLVPASSVHLCSNVHSMALLLPVV